MLAYEADDWGQQRDTMSQLLTSNPAKLETLTLLFPTLFQFGLGAMGNLLILQSSLGFGCAG